MMDNSLVFCDECGYFESGPAFGEFGRCSAPGNIGTQVISRTWKSRGKEVKVFLLTPNIINKDNHCMWHKPKSFIVVNIKKWENNNG